MYAYRYLARPRIFETAAHDGCWAKRTNWRLQMKLVIMRVALCLLLGTSVYALQRQDQERDKPAPQDEPRKQDKPDKDRDKDRDRQPDKRQTDRERSQEPKPQQERDRDREQQNRDRAQQQERDRQSRAQPDRERQDRDRAQGQDRDRRSPDAQREDRNRAQSQDRERQSASTNGQRGRRIPDDHFRSTFGREHTFHIQRGRSGGGGAVQRGEGQRFQYGGYWFEYTEPWPGDWSYDDDDYYIDYIDDDYYLYDRRHPGMRILVIVVE
jgi:hypothetical protein